MAKRLKNLEKYFAYYKSSVKNLLRYRSKHGYTVKKTVS